MLMPPPSWAQLLSTTAVQGDFTATGPEGEWKGLTQLNITSDFGPLLASGKTVIRPAPSGAVFTLIVLGGVPVRANPGPGLVNV